MLNLNETQAQEDRGRGLVALAEALAARREATGWRLGVLSLNGNYVDDDCCVLLGPALAAAGVREVILGKNRIGNAGGRALAAACRLEGAPRKLSLLNNHLGDGAAAAFGEVLGGGRRGTGVQAASF